MDQWWLPRSCTRARSYIPRPYVTGAGGTRPYVTGAEWRINTQMYILVVANRETAALLLRRIGRLVPRVLTERHLEPRTH